MKLTKIIAIMLVVCMLGVALVSCGGNTADGTTDATTAATTGSDEPVTPKQGNYTYNLAMSVFPTNWNPHTYETNDDSTILGYTSQGFFTFDYNDTLDGYKVVPEMATKDPEDVTSQFVGKYGITEDSVNQVYKLTLRSDMKWEDGTPITAHDFVTSAKLLLDPIAQNYRADSLYSGNLVLANSKAYLYQGQSVYSADESIGIQVADMTVGDDGQYYTAAGEPVYIGLNFAIPNWLNGNTLSKYVDAYGSDYFDVTNWPTLIAMVDDNGLVPLTKETYDLFVPVTTGNPNWGESEADIFNYLVIKQTYGEMSFDDVGIFATSDTELYLAIEKPLKGFYLLYSLTDSWLVKESLYKACESVTDGIYTNTYGTSVETTPSYGPYKLTQFQSDKIIVLERNDQWYGYNDAANKGLYQTTKVQFDFVAEPSTRLEMFINGLLDSYGLNAEDMADYAKSDYTYYTTGDSTFFMAFNPDLDGLKAGEANTGANINKTIITIPEFRQAMSFALNRSEFCLATSPTNNAAFAVFSSFIISNPDEGTAYRTTPQAKDVVVNFWGLADDIGEGKLYETIDDAIESVTGYNLTKAKALFDAAYDKAIADGLMDEDDVIEIKIGTPNLTSSFYNKGYDFICNNYAEAVKGTKLEGKLTFTRDGSLGNAFADALKTNSVDMLFGVGWTGSALDPYGLIEAYTGANYQYDPSWDTSSAICEIDLNGTVYSATVWDWTMCLAGDPITITDADGNMKEYSCGSSDELPEERLAILAALENAVLETYDMIPIMDDSSASLKGMQVTFYTEEYIYGVGRGGVKYMTYNYTDEEFAEFVAAQGGKLNYK